MLITKPTDYPAVGTIPGRTTNDRTSSSKRNTDRTCASCFFECALRQSSHSLIRERRIVRTWEKGEYLFLAGNRPEGVWSVCRGRVKIFQDTENGKQLITRIAGAGDLVGHRSLLADCPSKSYGVATEGTTTAFLPAAVVLHLIEIEPMIRTKLMRKLASELGYAESLATNMAYGNADDRVLAALAEICRNSTGSECVTPVELSVPRQELAELAGLTVEAAVRTLRRLEEAGILETHGRRILVLDFSRIDRPD